MAAIKLYELSNVFTAGPVSSTIAEVFTPLQEDIYAVMNLTNERAPFFSLQVEENEKVGKIFSNFTVNLLMSYLQTRADITRMEEKVTILENTIEQLKNSLETERKETEKVTIYFNVQVVRI